MTAVKVVAALIIVASLAYVAIVTVYLIVKFLLKAVQCDCLG